MVESNIVGAIPDAAVVRGQRDPGMAGERVHSLAIATRATLEVIGLVSVVILIALAANPDLRGPVFQIGSSFWAAMGDRSIEESAADEDGSGGEMDGPKIGQPVVLGPADGNVAVYLARRYHVADEAVRLMVATAHEAGKERQIDHLLILAVVAVESSMNPFAQSPVGATGLMQVMPALHGEKFLERNGDIGALDPVANIRVGSQILGDVIRRGGSVERGLQLYCGAGNLGDDGGYASRVLGELGRLKLAASGGIAAALAAGAHSDNRNGADGVEPQNSSAPAAELPAAIAQKQQHAA